MPVVDMEEQREMLEQKLRSHVASEVSKIGSALGGNVEVLGVKRSLKEMAAQFSRTLKENPEVSKSLVNSAVEHLQSLSSQVKEYENLLETNLSEVRSSIDIIRTQVKTMLSKVETENFFDLTVPVSA
jgi:Mg2+ and Co2+ transporter CorA